MKMFNYIGSNNKVFKSTVFLLLLAPMGVQLFFSSLTPKQRIIFALYSVFFLLFGYIGVYFGLRLSTFLMMWERVLNAWCNFLIIVGLIASVLHLIRSLQFISTIDDALKLAFGYTIFGLIIATYQFQKKYILA